MSNEIILTTLNARYMHCAFALRYLFANLGELQARAQIRELSRGPQVIVGCPGRVLDLLQQRELRLSEGVALEPYEVVWAVTGSA